MMHAHAHEIAGTCFFVQSHQIIGIKTIGFPGGDNILETKPGWMTVGLHVILILIAALDVYVSCIPVAILRGGLGPPMRPDAEFGIAEPFRHFILLQRFASGLKRAGRNIWIKPFSWRLVFTLQQPGNCHGRDPCSHPFQQGASRNRLHKSACFSQNTSCSGFLKIKYPYFSCKSVRWILNMPSTRCPVWKKS